MQNDDEEYHIANNNRRLNATYRHYIAYTRMMNTIIPYLNTIGKMNSEMTAELAILNRAHLGDIVKLVDDNVVSARSTDWHKLIPYHEAQITISKLYAMSVLADQSDS